MVDHLLPLDVRLGGIDYGWGWNGRSNAREIVCGAGGEALQGQVAHAQQVEGARHVVVLQIVQIVEAQSLVVATSLSIIRNEWNENEGNEIPAAVNRAPSALVDVPNYLDICETAYNAKRHSNPFPYVKIACKIYLPADSVHLKEENKIFQQVCKQSY